MQLELELIPTKEEICMMCHFSSECGGCCRICKKQCNNSKQICGLTQPAEEQINRLKTWLYLVKQYNMKDLRKFLIKGYK